MDVMQDQGGKDGVGGTSHLKELDPQMRVEEVVDEMLEGLRKATCINALEQMDEL